MKEGIQKLIRKAHCTLFSRVLPDRIAIYFHALQREHYGKFSEMAAWLCESGYKICASPAEWLATIGKAAWISFDDNYQSWYHALPLMERLGVRATFYVNTLPFRDNCDALTIAGYFRRIRHMGDQVSLSSAELLEIRQAGHNVGCHTHSHFCLSSIPEEEGRQQIMKSRDILQDILQEVIVDFAYPFGFRRHFRESLRSWCLGIGLKTIANATPGLLFAPQTPCRLNRHGWRFERTLRENLEDISVDGRVFVALTGRNPVP